MSKIDCDVLVIGTGPGGAISSYYASEKGANVLMVDKKSEVGLPIRCGEGLPGTVLDDFEIKHTKAIVPNKCKFLKLVPPKGKDIIVEPHLDVCVLNREKLEQLLVKRSLRKGTKVMMRTTAIEGERKGGIISKVKLIREGEDEPFTVKPKVIIAADGVESRVGRWIGLKTTISLKDIGTCAQYLVKHKDIDMDVIEFWFGNKYIPMGYSWVFPKGKEIANIGIGIIPNKKTNPVQVVDGFIDLRAKGGKKRNFTVGCIPSSRPVKQSVKGNMMLVGDAARQVMALTGAGIANALQAGRIAGSVAGEVCKGAKGIDHLKTYDARWRKIMEKKLEKNYKYRKKVVSNEKELVKFFRKVRIGLAIYKIAPKGLAGRIFQNFFYKGGGGKA